MTKIEIRKSGRTYAWRITRCGKVVNHRYNRRASAIKSLLAFLGSIQSGKVYIFERDKNGKETEL